MNSPSTEAARWFTRLLHLPAEHPERQAFREWLAADPRHAAEYQAFSELWADFSSTDRTTALAGSMERIGRRRVLRNGVLGLLLIGGLGSLLALRYRSAQQPFYTAIGERRRVTLEDGSELVLDADTQLQVHYDGDSRQVFLLRGRAIFDVRHDARRPFTVEAGLARVRVLGTRFVVERFAERARVSVARGRVEVSSGAQQLVLEAGQVVQADTQGRLERLPRPASLDFSFEHGSLSFDRADLREVAVTLSRYRARPVRVEGPTSAVVTAVLQVSDIEHFLDSLPQVAAVQREERPQATVLRAR